MSDGIQYVSIDDEDEPKRCCGGKVSRKTCYIILAVSLAFLTAVVIAGVLLLPKIAQNAVDNIDITFSKLTITNPTDTNFTIAMVGSLSATPFDAAISPMVLHINYNNHLMGSSHIAAKDAKAGKPTLLDEAVGFEIADMTVFEQFTSDMIRNDFVEWHLQSTIDVTATVLGVDLAVPELRFDKFTTLAGLSGLSQLEVVAADLSHSTAEQVEAMLTATIFNPSVIEMDPAGDLTMEVFYEGMSMGTAYSYNTSLLSGMNIVNLTNIMHPHPSDDPRAEALFSKLLAGEKVDVVINASSSSVPLYSPALEGLVIDTGLTIDVPALLGSVTINRGGLQLRVADQTQFGLLLDADIEVVSPLGADCPFDVQTAAMEVHLYDARGREVIRSTTDPVPVQNGSTPVVTITLDSTAIIVDQEAFSDFAADLISSKTVTMHMLGTSNVSTTTVMGRMDLFGIAIDAHVEMQGLAGFEGVDLQEQGLQVLGGSAGGIQVSATLQATGTSNVGMDLGAGSNLTLTMLYKGKRVGTSVVPHFTLQPGLNVAAYPVVMGDHQSDKEALNDMLTRYMIGQDSAVQIFAQGPQPSAYPLLAKALLQFNQNMAIRGQHDKLVLQAYMHTLSVNPFKSIIPTSLVVANPFDAAIEIVSSNTSVIVTSSNITIATVIEDLHDTPIFIPARGTMETQKLNFHYVVQFETLKALFKSATKGIDLTMAGGTLGVRFGGPGGLEVQIAYEQSGVTTFLSG